MREFTPPPITTKGNIGAVSLDYAFKIEAEFDPRRQTRTPRGGRLFQPITGGVISGPRLNGKVYPDSGGELDFVRPDRVEDINARFMLNADNGEWIYVEHSGYHRQGDGYYRVAAFFDAEGSGNYAWLNDTIVIATAQLASDGRRAVFTYYAVG
jgi:hypothetical protein